MHIPQEVKHRYSFRPRFYEHQPQPNGGEEQVSQQGDILDTHEGPRPLPEEKSTISHPGKDFHPPVQDSLVDFVQETGRRPVPDRSDCGLETLVTVLAIGVLFAMPIGMLFQIQASYREPIEVPDGRDFLARSCRSTYASHMEEVDNVALQRYAERRDVRLTLPQFQRAAKLTMTQCVPTEAEMASIDTGIKEMGTVLKRDKDRHFAELSRTKVDPVAGKIYARNFDKLKDIEDLAQTLGDQTPDESSGVGGLAAGAVIGAVVGEVIRHQVGMAGGGVSGGRR